MTTHGSPPTAVLETVLETRLDELLFAIDELDRTVLDDVQLRLVRSVRASARGLREVLAQLHRTPEDRAGAPSAVPFRLSMCLRGMRNRLVSRATEPPRLVTSIGDGVPDAVVGDDLRLQQLLTELVDAAAAQAGSNEVSVRVIHAVPHTPGLLRFEVASTRARPAVEPVQRGGESLSATGAGLRACRELTARMGGRLGVATGTECDVMVWVELPLPLCSATELRAPIGSR